MFPLMIFNAINQLKPQNKSDARFLVAMLFIFVFLPMVGFLVWALYH
jgi:hypothetical protein